MSITQPAIAPGCPLGDGEELDKSRKTKKANRA